jgi:hypothetical protein
LLEHSEDFTSDLWGDALIGTLDERHDLVEITQCAEIVWRRWVRER